MATMRTLNLQKIYDQLETSGMCLNPDFAVTESVDAPILDQVAILLDAVGEKGLKLTPKGKLPTKIVEAITRCRPTLAVEGSLDLHKRFKEDEHIPAMRARTLCKVAKLVGESNGKLVPGSMAPAYGVATASQRYLYLFGNFMHVNLAYFDAMQSLDALNGIAAELLQLLRDRDPLHRDVDVYAEMLFDAFPAMAVFVDSEVKIETYGSADPFDTFVRLLAMRGFERFFAPFGLCDEEAAQEPRRYRYRKTDLLDRLLLPVNAVRTDLVLNKKRFAALAKRIRDEKLDVELLNDFCFFYTVLAQRSLPTSQALADDLVMQKGLVGSEAERQRAFYRELAESTIQTVLRFSQVDAKGARSDLTDEFVSLIDGILSLLPGTTPFHLFEAMQPITLFMFQLLQTRYDIDINAGDFHEQCVARFDAEVAEEIGVVFYLMGELHKKTRKAKRITAQINQLSRDTVMAYLYVVMSIHTFS